nr:hypothetical protein [Actinomyces sp. VPI D163E-3]
MASRVSDHHEFLNTVSGLEGLHHGSDCENLGPVALPAADLQGELMTVDQKLNDDLRLVPPLFGVTNPPQIILTLGLELQSGNVIQAQG